MSFIQAIRDKYARVAVILIALSLIGFILTDYISGRGSNLFGGGGPSSVVGRVNGKKINITEFEAKVKQQEDYQKTQQYFQGGEAGHQQIIQQVWDQEVNRILLDDEFARLGLGVGKRELNDILFGANPPDDIKKAGIDPQTGAFNPALAQQAINDLRTKGTPENKAQFNQYIDYLEANRMNDKFNALFTNSVNYPRWFAEKQNGDNSLMARISVVKEEYTSIRDSSITITDKEIDDYVSKHKSDFKQDETRSISFVAFSALPTAADSLAIRQKLEMLKIEFDTTQDLNKFFIIQGVANNNYNGYVRDTVIQFAAKDSIFKLPVGGVYGPYFDGGNYALAKLIGKKQYPDSAKVRHILVATAQQDPQTGEMRPTRDTASAKAIMDTVRALISSGQNFDSVTAKYSEDPGSNQKGGVYEYFSTGRMVSEFNDFSFSNPVGTKGVVKTDFGYHYIEILGQKGSGTAYKIAYFPLTVTASNQTDMDASNKANLFAGDSRDIKSFEANYEKNLKSQGFNKLVATDIKPTDFQIQSLGISRNFVKEIYKAKLGEVLQPERIGEDYVVAVVTEVNKEGTRSAAKARPMVEPLLRNKKKGEMLKQKLGTITTLEAAAAAWGGKQILTADSLRMSGTRAPVLPIYEPKINGAVFNPANKGKVIPVALAGANGVYVVRVDEVIATAIADANIAEKRKNMYQQGKASGPQYAAIQALRTAAKIADKRSTHPQF
jgi:peptidyl-prolyl cis-trans isomerase D